MPRPRPPYFTVRFIIGVEFVMPAPEPQRLLKAHSTQRLGPSVAFNYDDLRRQCDEYLAQTREHARKLVADAHAEAAEIRRQAVAAGHAEGQAQGLQSAGQAIAARAAELANQQTADRLRTTLPALEAVTAGLHVERDRWIAAWETAAIRLSVAIAEKILRGELERQPSRAVQMIPELLQLAAGIPQLKIRMHPLDVAELGPTGQDVLDRFCPVADAVLVADEQVSRGGCLIETRHGVIDGRLETQLARVAAELLEGN